VPTPAAIRAQLPEEFDHPFLRFVGPITSLDELVTARSFDRQTEIVDCVQADVIPCGDTHLVRYRPVGCPELSGALLWIHGGGLIMGSVASAHAFCSELARALQIQVLSLEYRLAPEHPFPAGLDDCMASVTWVVAHLAELWIDPTRVVIGGDSAGGGLAAAVTQRLADEQQFPFAGQILKYPMLDDRSAERDDVEGLIWLQASNRFAWSAYAGDSPRDVVYLAPGRRTDLSNLPPAWIGVGTLDLFYEEDQAYAQRLRASGVDVQWHEVPLMYHGTDVLCPDAPAMRAFREDMESALARWTRAL
jgi:acetyl esterase/lipase